MIILQHLTLNKPCIMLGLLIRKVVWNLRNKNKPAEIVWIMHSILSKIGKAISLPWRWWHSLGKISKNSKLKLNLHTSNSHYGKRLIATKYPILSRIFQNLIRVNLMRNIYFWPNRRITGSEPQKNPTFYDFFVI